MKCPFRYVNSKPCSGSITSFTLVKGNINVSLNEFGEVTSIKVKPRCHVHLHCNDTNAPSMSFRRHPEIVVMLYEDLPETIRQKIEGF